MQIPLLNGIYTAQNSDYRTSYPVNLIPVPKPTGIANGYLRPAWGLVSNGTGPGIGRGGINWKGVLYRVIGNDLVSIDSSGNVTTVELFGLRSSINVGAGPQKPHSDGTYVWVPNYTDGTVSRITIATSAVSTIAVGTNPIACFSDTTYCWVSNFGSNNVTRITIATSATANIAVGNAPVGIYSDASSVWVANSGSDTVSKIDIGTSAVTDTISVGDTPWGLDGDGTFIFVANSGSGSNTISKILNTTVLSTILVGTTPKWLYSDSSNVYVSNNGNDTVSKVDVATDQILSTISVGQDPLDIYSDGTYVYVICEGDDKINRITIATEYISLIAVGDTPKGFVIDSTYFWVTNFADDDVTRFIKASNSSISGSDLATFDYSSDYLSLSANNKLWLYDGTDLKQVTDADLGTVIDHIYVDGYFMTTDGTYLIVTELADPFSVDPAKYGSSEADPDSIKALLKIRNEPYALNRYTIEAYDNVGGSGFPFARIETSQIEKGTLGTQTCCVFLERIAFLGSGRNESPSIYLGYNGITEKIATREIDLILKEYTETELSTVLLESVLDENHQFLFVHLPNEALVFDGAASSDTDTKVWFHLTSSLTETKSQYLARNFIWVYDKWMIEDPSSTKIGYITSDSANHYSNPVRWEFQTLIIYNQAKGAVLHQLELVGLTGRNAADTETKAWTEYSIDGETWSSAKPAKLGKIGNRNKRAVFFKQGKMRQQRMQKFWGNSIANFTIAALEAEMEGLDA